jgi:hypothetical protein
MPRWMKKRGARATDFRSTSGKRKMQQLLATASNGGRRFVSVGIPCPLCGNDLRVEPRGLHVIVICRQCNREWSL